MKLRDDIALAKANDALRDAAIRHGWLENHMANRRSGWGKGNEGVVKAKLAFRDALAEGRVLGIYKKGLPVGFLVLGESGDRTVKIGSLFVDPEERRTHIAQTALHNFIEACFSGGKLRVEVELPYFNKPGHKLLKSVGFWGESVKKSALWMDGEAYDTGVYRVLKQFWDKDKETLNARSTDRDAAPPGGAEPRRLRGERRDATGPASGGNGDPGSGVHRGEPGLDAAFQPAEPPVERGEAGSGLAESGEPGAGRPAQAADAA